MMKATQRGVFWGLVGGLGVLLASATLGERMLLPTVAASGVDREFARLDSLSFRLRNHDWPEAERRLRRLDPNALAIPERGGAARTKVLTLQLAVRLLVEAGQRAWERGERLQALRFAEAARALAERGREMPVSEEWVRSELSYLPQRLKTLPPELRARLDG